MNNPKTKLLLTCVALAALSACGGGSQDDAVATRMATEAVDSPSSDQAAAASILEGLAAQYPNGQLPEEKAVQAAIELAQSPAVLTTTASDTKSAAQLVEEVSEWVANVTRKVTGAKAASTLLYKPVVRFRTPSGYFYTSSQAEADAIASQYPDWVREGTAMHGSSQTNWGLSPVYRFRNTEKQNIVDNLSATFTLEGTAWFSSQSAGSGFKPVYRFRNVTNGSYLWTGVEAEKDAIVANFAGIFVLEGVAFHTPIAAPNEVFVEMPIKLNNGLSGHKPKIQRQGDGT